MLKFKKVRSSLREKAHTLVYNSVKNPNNDLLGYYLRDADSLDIEKWFFISKCKFPFFKAKTEREVKEILDNMYNGVPIRVNQHFGITTVYNIETIIEQEDRKDNAFWYYDEEILSVNLPNRERLIVESRGEIRIQFVNDEDYDHYLEGFQAVEHANKKKYTDNDINNEDKVIWDMNNWFAIVKVDADNNVISDDLGIAHDYDEAIDTLIEVYNEL